MQDEHLDHALEQEFAGHGATIHKLKVAQPHFKGLLESNHKLWLEIQAIKTGVAPASDETLETLEKQRLRVLDEIGAMIRRSEAGA